MSFFNVIYSIFGLLMGSKGEPSAPAPLPVVKKGIDWTNPEDKVSKHFTVKECIWLPTWKRLANADDGLDDTVKQNLIDLCAQMDVVREYIDKPINVHVCYRPQEYNKLVGGASKSAHVEGKAIDFHVSDMTCDEFRKKIVDENKLENWDMRCEDMPGSSWVHLDIAPVKFKRFFKP